MENESTALPLLFMDKIRAWLGNHVTAIYAHGSVTGSACSGVEVAMSEGSGSWR